jgi:hypothetical protein
MRGEHRCERGGEREGEADKRWKAWFHDGLEIVGRGISAAAVWQREESMRQARFNGPKMVGSSADVEIKHPKKQVIVFHRP